jgi:hypothetical protein
VLGCGCESGGRKKLEKIIHIECAIPGRVTMRMKRTLEIINMTGDGRSEMGLTDYVKYHI